MFQQKKKLKTNIQFIMKKSLLIISSLFLTIIMQAQIIPQPKSGPTPTVKIGKPETFELKNGLKVIIVENHKLPRVTFSLSLDNPPMAEGDKKGVSDMLSAIMGSGTTTISKDAFNEEVDFLGANINISAGGASASSLSKFSARVLELMADGALHPLLTQEEFDKQKAKVLEGLKSEEKNVSSVAGRVGSVLPFGVNHPFGEYISEKTINNITLEDVKNYYKANFVPGNAYLIVVGDVKLKETKKMVEKLFKGWAKAKAPSVVYPDPKNVTAAQINFVDMPNAVQSEISAVNLVNLKMTDPDYFAAIIANQILGGDFNSYINMNLREAHGWTYGASSSISGGRYISKFEASTQVRNAVTDSAVVEMLKEYKRIRTEKVAVDELNIVKAGYIGRFVMQIEKPQTVATYALRTQTQGLPADFYENYIKSINAVTPDDILRVANKYFLVDNIRMIIVGKATDVLPGLEKLNMPIAYFDKWGNPAEKPVLKRDAPAGVTTKTVLDNYIKSVGGEKAMKSVKTILTKGTTSIPQAPSPLDYKVIKDVSGKMVAEISMGGMVMMKQVVNEKEAYVAQQGQKMKVEGQELADMKAEAIPFEELNLAANPAGLTLSGIESINGNDAYAIVNGETTMYYDVKSGLKTAIAQTKSNGDQKMVLMTNYNDYREVKGVKVPYNIIQNVGIELNIKINEVKINEGVTASDFQ
jgi:predicted Zn-dependent peptidase